MSNKLNTQLRNSLEFHQGKVKSLTESLAFHQERVQRLQAAVKALGEECSPRKPHEVKGVTREIKNFLKTKVHQSFKLEDLMDHLKPLITKPEFEKKVLSNARTFLYTERVRGNLARAEDGTITVLRLPLKS